MSKSLKQSENMLGAVVGCFSQIVTHRHYSRVDIIQAAKGGREAAFQALIKWPRDKQSRLPKTAEELILRNEYWAIEMGARQEKLSGPVLLYIASRIVQALESKLKNTYKLSLLNRIKPYIETITNFADPLLQNHLAFEEGDKMLDILFVIIGWEEEVVKWPEHVDSVK